MKPVGIDPPPSRRVVDRYGFFGVLYGAALLTALLLWAALLALAELARWAYRRLTEGGSQ